MHGETQMPGGGIGPLRLEQSQQLRNARRSTPLPAGMSDSELFYHLGLGRVFYDPPRGLLYFVDSVSEPIHELVAAVLGRPVSVEQLYLDRHGVFNAAKRLTLSAGEAEPVLVALRLQGILVLKPDAVERLTMKSVNPEAPDAVDPGPQR
ncbi:MAG: hypothetical protein ACPG4N_00670 [Gammaproteobacteria bacterium]